MVPSDFTSVPTKPDINNVALLKVYEEAYQNGADDMLEQFIDYLEGKGIVFKQDEPEIMLGTGDNKSFLIKEQRFNQIRKDCYSDGYESGFEDGYNEGRRFQNKTWEQYKLDENI